MDNIPTDTSQKSCVLFKGVTLFIPKSTNPTVNKILPLNVSFLIDSAT